LSHARFIITNGDHAADAIRAGFPGAHILPWRDALVEGPVLELADDEYCSARARHLAVAFGHDYDQVRADFVARQHSFAEMTDTADAIELWFETDLHDQLQVIEVLARLAAAGRRPHVTLTQVPPPLAKHDLAKMAAASAEVSSGQFAAATAMWTALRSQTPEALAREARLDIPLPAARAALRRLLEELPAPVDGLSRIERETLRAIASGADSPVAAFRSYMASEELPFLGDAGFFARLIALGFVFGLIEGLPQFLVWDRATRRYEHGFLNAAIALTDRGRAALAGTYDLTTHERFNRWVGATHLQPRAVWRWDRERRALLAPE
jgi:hypothetical protein